MKKLTDKKFNAFKQLMLRYYNHLIKDINHNGDDLIKINIKDEIRMPLPFDEAPDDWHYGLFHKIEEILKLLGFPDFDWEMNRVSKYFIIILNDNFE